MGMGENNEIVFNDGENDFIKLFAKVEDIGGTPRVDRVWFQMD